SPMRKNTAMITVLLCHRSVKRLNRDTREECPMPNEEGRFCEGEPLRYSEEDPPMNWFEQRIRRYEHRRWTTDDNRHVRPFEWGLEHLDGGSGQADPAAFLHEYSANAIARSREWFEP